MSNLVLDEMDKELESRGHSYVRYAEDISIYGKSEKAAQRVLESTTEYIEKKLKLRVNQEEIQVSQPNRSTLLGFSFFWSRGKWEIQIVPKSLKRIKEKIRWKTKNSFPWC